MTTLQLPAVYAPLLHARGLVVVAAQRVGSRELRVAIAVAALCLAGRRALIVDDPRLAADELRGWTGEQPRRVGSRYEWGDLVIATADDSDAMDGAAAVVAVSASRDADPARLVKSESVDPLIVIGASNAPWLRAWVARAQGARAAIITPDLASVEEQVTPEPPFLTFARSRLKVRTDKVTLSPTQVDEAREQLGDGWASGRVGAPIVSFHVNAVQRRYLAMKRLGQRRGFSRFLLLKYRRGGFTTLEQALSYRLAATRPSCHVATLAHTAESTRRIFRIAQLFHERDPEAPRRVGDSSSRLELENGSYFFIGTAGGKAFSRGDTLQRVHGSEVAWWGEGPHSDEGVEQVVAAILGAAQHGEVVLETTPNGREWFHRTYQEAKSGASGWWPIFIPWHADPTNVAAPGTYSEEEVRDTLTAEERALGLSVPQVAFRRQGRQLYKRLFVQEFPEDDQQCFLAGGHCYFDSTKVAELLDALAATPAKLAWQRAWPGAVERRWEEPIPGVEYAAGCDTSEGIPGCDPNGVVIVRRDTGDQVCDLHGLLNPSALATHAARLSKVYNDALLGVERENHGHAVLQKLVELHMQPHFFGGSLYYHHRGGDVRHSRAGWSTNEGSRSIMLSDLAEAVEGGHLKVRDPELLGEMLCFRLQHDGKFSADSGSHDDRVMKMAIAWQMRKARKVRPGISILGGTL